MIQNKALTTLLDKHKLILIDKASEAIKTLSSNINYLFIDKSIIHPSDYDHVLNELKSMLDRIYGIHWFEHRIKSIAPED